MLDAFKPQPEGCRGVRPVRVRWAPRVCVIVCSVALVGFGAWALSILELKLQVAELLGPNGTADRIDVKFHTVTLTRVKLRAPREWPTQYSFRADHVVVVLDLLSIFSTRVRAEKVFVDGYELSIVRAKDGSVQVLPRLTSREREADGQTAAAAERANADKLVDQILLTHGTIEIFDKAIQNTPYRITITNAGGSANHLDMPNLADPTTVKLTGSMSAPPHTGDVFITGSITLANSDSRLALRLRNANVTVFNPYLIKEAGGEAKTRSGTVDLLLEATVKDGRIHAPGSIVLKHLELDQKADAVATIASIPANSAVAALKDSSGTIRLKFELDGNLQDPHFSLTQSLDQAIVKGLPNAASAGASEVVRSAAQAARSAEHKIQRLLPK